MIFETTHPAEPIDKEDIMVYGIMNGSGENTQIQQKADNLEG